MWNAYDLVCQRQGRASIAMMGIPAMRLNSNNLYYFKGTQIYRVYDKQITTNQNLIFIFLIYKKYYIENINY